MHFSKLNRLYNSVRCCRLPEIQNTVSWVLFFPRCIKKTVFRYLSHPSRDPLAESYFEVLLASLKEIARLPLTKKQIMSLEVLPKSMNLKVQKYHRRVKHTRTEKRIVCISQTGKSCAVLSQLVVNGCTL